MKINKNIKVFTCCGKYIAVDHAITDTIKCPSCGRILKAPLQTPKIITISK